MGGEEAVCPKCGRLLFRMSKNGKAIRGLQGIVFTVISATCCGVVVRNVGGAIEYEREGQRVETTSV